MPDLLVHVLSVYVVGRVGGWVGPVDRAPDRWVAVGMVGTILPDLAKLYLLVDAATVAAVLGRPFHWAALHTLGPAATLAGLGALCFPRCHRRAAFGWLLGGVGLHLLCDLAVTRAGGVAPPYLYPLTWWEPPSADLLLSSDPWPAAVAVAVAAVVWVVDRRLR
jgi:membrane-bound metal-dependent hydrolase YbcI (DUF457 family)